MAIQISRSVENRSLDLFHKGFVQPAIDVLEIELNQSPDQGHLWELRAIFLHSQKKWLESRHAAETASALVPLGYAGQLVLADDYSFTGKQELALFLYQWLLSDDAIPTHFYPGLYAGFKRVGHFQEALATCRKATQRSPDNDEAFFGMAHCMARLGYRPQSIAYVLQRAFQLAPDKSHYRISLVVQFLRMQKKADAYRVLSSAQPSILDGLACPGCVRKLLELCSWAGDAPRCLLLGRLQAVLSHQREPIAATKEGDND